MIQNNQKNEHIDSIDPTITYFPLHKIWIILPISEVATKIATFIPIILMGIIGNLIILNIIIRNRALRTPTNLLIANMAAADMATLLICPIMFLYHDFYQNYKLGPFGCKMEGFLEGATLITAVLNLCAVSYDRLTAIVLPMEARLTIRGAKIVMIFTWFMGIFLSIPLAIYRTYVERHWINFLEIYCKEDQTILPKYWNVLIAALVWFPLAVMIISYSAIFHKLDRYEKQVLKREHPLCVSYKTKVAKILFIIVIVFVVLRVPFTVLVFLRYDKLLRNWAQELTPSFQALWYASHYLLFLNAAINPIIYGLNNDNFRRAYNQTPIFKCFYKSKTRQQKRSGSFGRLFIGVLQPRGPYRIDKQPTLNGFKTLFSSKENNFQFGTCYGSKTTKTTNIRQTDQSDLVENNNSKLNQSFYNGSNIEMDNSKTEISLNSAGFI